MFNNEMIWFTGVVEDRHDPLMMSRVRVRIFGIHTNKKALLPTEDLPWSTVMLPTTASGVSGLQSSPHGLIEGSWVVGFFRDGPDMQDPLVMGSIASMSAEAPNPEQGFSDPNAKYPKEDYIGISDVNLLAVGGDTEDKVVETKKAEVAKAVKTANNKGTWDQPETPYASVYPFNKVYQSESGHIIEIDDTEGAERLHEYHKSGTFREVHPDGTIVTKIVGEDYLVVVKDNNINVQGNVNLTIDQSCTTYIKGDWNIQVDGNKTEHIKGNVIENISGNVNTSVSGTENNTVSGKWTRNSSSSIADNAPRIDHN